MQFLLLISVIVSLIAADVSARPSDRGHAPAAPDFHNVQRRDITETLCDVQGWPYAPVAPLREHALAELKGNASERYVSGDHCFQWWCGYGAAIFVCNNSGGNIQLNDLTVATCVDVLTGGEPPSQDCLDPSDPTMVQGQVFDSFGFNLIVRGFDGNSCVPGQQTPI